jgi:hypothetical protein
VDPTLSEFQRAMEQALRPGAFIEYGVSHDFVRGLESVAERLNKLTLTDPGSAVQLYETFIGACHEKAEELDDSGGNLAMFVQQLFVDWVRARQVAEHDAADTVRRLIAWIDDDPYGFCLHLEPHVAKAMDAQHLSAFARLARERLQQTAPDDRGSAGYPRRRWTEALKHVIAARRDAEAYVELCRASGLSAADCSVVAEMIEHLGRPEEALAWVEQGLSLARKERLGGGAEYELKKRHRELLRGLGRVAEAVASAWADFDEHPSQFSYRSLLELVPADERHTWRSRALTRGESADLGSAIDLFIESNETDRLARCVSRAPDAELEELSHYTTEPAATALRSSHAELAARLYRALAVRILDAKKSKFYGAALQYLEHARACYEAAGLEADWISLVDELRQVHRRKSSFIPGLERVVRRMSEPSFFERAKRRWSR